MASAFDTKPRRMFKIFRCSGKQMNVTSSNPENDNLSTFRNVGKPSGF
jgi:hypothetical protein